jgi:hypothetical protein
MAKKGSNAKATNSAEWRKFEQLVATIERLMAPKGAIVKSPDRIRDIDTNRLREVDASIRLRAGSIEILVTVECRRRSRIADVTWIEQLATKRNKIGASKTIAVSPLGFSNDARKCASRYGIELKILGEITSSDIEAWFMQETFIHSFRKISAIKCDVLLCTGQSEIVYGLDPRFKHPLVHGDFPACAFLNFIEMKDPDAFGRTQHDEHEREIRFELDGNDRNLIPVPLGERTKSGVLELRICDQYFRVHKFVITATIRYLTDELAPAQGKHFLYGTPEKPDALFSDYGSEMFGMPVKIERLKTEKDRVGSASITFPSGLRLPGTLISTRITNISKVDVSKIHLCRILFKLSGKDQFEARIIEPEVLFKFLGRKIENFDRDCIAFIEEHDWQKIVDGVGNNPDGIVPTDILKSVQRKDVEYIELSPAIERTQAPFA